MVLGGTLFENGSPGASRSTACRRSSRSWGLPLVRGLGHSSRSQRSRRRHYTLSVPRKYANGQLLNEAGRIAQFYVTEDLCTHGPGLLHEGYIDGDIVECNFHNGSFNIKTGEVVDPPCMIPIKTYRTVVEGDKVFIET